MRGSMKGSFVFLAIIFSIMATGVNAGASVLTVTDPGQPAGASVAAGAAGTLVGQLSLSVDTGALVVTGLKISNSGTAVHKDDIFALSLYADSNGNGSIDLGTDDFLSNAYWSGSEFRYVFADIALDVVAGTPLTLLIAMHTAAGAEVGRFFAMSAIDTGISIEDDADTVNPYAITGSSFDLIESAAAGSAIAEAPTVILLNPSNGAVVSGTFRVQVQVYNPDGLNNLISLELSKDGGSSTAYSFDLVNDLNPNYNVGTNAGIYETALTLAPGGYTIVVDAQNSLASVNSLSATIVTQQQGMGDGHLLRRDNSNQLCADCHGLKSHSSQATGNKYGSWALGCRDCHTPHDTTNIYLIKEKIAVPNFNGVYLGTATVRFWETTGIEAPTPSYANQDNSGPCQVCHTRTEGPGGVARWRNTGNADTHYSDSGNPVRCTVCHLHSEGFTASPDETSSYCNACHLSSSGGGSDLESYAWGDGMTAMVDLDEWLGSGHGRDTSYDSGNPGADFRGEADGGCRYCHDDQIAHNGAGIAYFRLKDQGTGPAGSWGPYNGTCLVCHATLGSTGYQPTGYSSPRNASVKVDSEAHDGAKHDDDHSGGRLCWDCHDPHGDDSGAGPSSVRWFMIQRNPVKDRDETTKVPSSNASTVTFENASTYVDYYSGGLCVNCHTSTDHYPGSKTDDHPYDDYGITERCTSCHLHDTGFENVDNCPGDPAKTDPGICGCGIPDTDEDSDGFYVCEDCDDTDPNINPDTIWYLDGDSDGFGDYSQSIQQCTQPSGPSNYVLDNNDYDDNDPYIGAPVKIDGGQVYFYSSLQDAYDAASDGDIIKVIFVNFVEDLFANRNISVMLQGGYDGLYSAISGDSILQGDMDVSNGTLTIENFILSDPASIIVAYYFDADGDSFFNATSDGTCVGIGCEPPGSQTVPGNDCDDENAAINPDTFWYQDNDGDGFGNYSLSLQQCTQPTGPPNYVLDDNDYDDYNADIGAPVKIDSGTVYFYSSLQDAYDAAADGDTIQVIYVTFVEDLFVDRNISVTLIGGYDGSYSTISGDSTLEGIMDVSDGTLTIENFVLQ